MRYRYQALQRDGRLVYGLIEAPSERGAHRELLRRGIQPTTIDSAAATAATNILQRRRRRLTTGDYALALKQLHALVAGGVPVGEAVATLAEGAGEPGLAGAYEALTTGLRQGEAFPSAFARCFPGIPAHVHRMVEAGDFSGRLAAALADAAATLDQEAKIRAELRQTLLYPAFLVIFGIAAIVFIFLVVVPRFAVMFTNKFDKLPLLSFVVISAGLWFRAHLAFVVSLALASVAVGVWGSRQARLRHRLFDLAMRLPLLRSWSGDVDVARWAAVVARLLENRVPLLQGLELARSVVRRRDMQLRLSRVERDVRAGAALAAALADSGFLTPAALAMVRVGERSGSLPEMVSSLATLYEERVRSRSRLLLAVIEPTAILIIGAVIGLVAMAVFMAITSINKVPGL